MNFSDVVYSSMYCNVLHTVHNYRGIRSPLKSVRALMLHMKCIEINRHVDITTSSNTITATKSEACTHTRTHTPLYRSRCRLVKHDNISKDSKMML